jgi:hypothetical protein
VFETHFDADQSGGAFLTEKTFKPIKHGQLFFIAGLLAVYKVLRDQGYRCLTVCWITHMIALNQQHPTLASLFCHTRAQHQLADCLNKHEKT